LRWWRRGVERDSPGRLIFQSGRSRIRCLIKRRIISGIILVLALEPAWLAGARAADAPGFVDLRRAPDAVRVVTETATNELRLAGGKWRSDDMEVTTRRERNGLAVELQAPTRAVKRVELRWPTAAAPGWRFLGDAWERAYGDLEWKERDGARVMPWYFLASDGVVAHGFGVKTGAGTLCYWTVDSSNIILHADARCGGRGVLLGRRELKVCTVVCRAGRSGETPFAAARAFCQMMCPDPVLPQHPVYGFNDWYCSYGHDTADGFLTNVAYLTSLIPAGGNRPFAVVDDGWQAEGKRHEQRGAWNEVRPSFSKSLTMPGFAREIEALGAQPGLWCRPLIANDDAPAGWRLARDRNFLDPTVPEVRRHIRQLMARFAGWGYRLIKHDYTTDDLLGRWGFEMGSQITPDGWAFADRSRTTAEVIRDLYEDIREGAGRRALILGCNTMGHLSAGLFEMQRIGDDTSGREWSRTRKMGVNCLAFRAPQDGAFFAVDADCAGQSTRDSVPWEKNSQWLDLLARSGTVVFVSFPREAVGPEREGALRAALIAASRRQPLGEPEDWFDSRTPSRWLLDGKEADYAW